MNIKQIKEALKTSEYDFLREDKNLGDNIILLTLGGSHAYGTNNENSDLDVRGCALNSKMQILTNENFEQFVNEATDTTIYSFNKLISLLSNCNPNTIEMLGNKPEHYLLNDKEAMAMGPLDVQSYLFEHKYQQANAMRNAKKVVEEVSREFEKMTGRKYSFFEEYKMEDAEIVVVCMNSTAGTTKFVVDNLREKGIKAGLVKLRMFRPFPAEEIAKALSKAKAVAVLDKADSTNGAGGALFTDVTSAMFLNNVNTKAVNYIYGIGGRDTTSYDIEGVYNDLIEIAKTGDIGNPYRYFGVRREK